MALADTAELVIALNLKGNASSGLRAFDQQLKGMRGGLRDIGTGIGQVGSGLDRLATRGALAAAAGLGAVVTTAASFEQAFTGVEKTVDGTAAQLGELEETFRQMARTMPVTFEELSAIGEAGGALGIARDSLDEFVDVVARLGVSTDLSSDQAATALGQLGNVLHLTESDFEDFADSLVALGNAGASTESQIVDIAARFGAAGNSAGLSKEEILALSSAVASMGIEAEAGGSSLSRIFGNVATAIGTGGDEVEAFTDLLGISAKEFKERWSRDALGTFEDFLKELGKLDQFGQAKVLEEAGITGVRDINAVRLMAQNVEFLGDQLTIAEGATGALDKESQKFFDTTAGQWKILQNNVRDAAATLGAELLPVVNDVMSEFVDFLQDPKTQAGLKDFAKDLAGGVKDLVTQVKNADFGPLIDTMKGAASVAKGAFDAFNALPDPVKQLALAAIVGNKVTGGALGSIAGGLGNILKGVIKIGFERGSSPANPMFVKDVGLPGTGGGGPNVPTTTRGGSTGGAAKTIKDILGGALKLIPIAGLELLLAEAVGEPIYESLFPVAHEFNELLAQTKGRPASLQLAEGQVQGLANEIGVPVDELKADMIPLLQSGNRTWEEVLAEIRNSNAPGPRVQGGSFATPRGGASSDTVLTREFGGKLDKLATNEVIEHLSRTTEIGLKGVGTTFQVGLTTGLDPLGDIATKILTRAEDPKAPPVMAEIKGHLSGLEEIQQTYLNQGDVKLAQKVQTNIDTLNGLIGKTDEVRAVTQYLSQRSESNDAAMLSTARVQTQKLTEASGGITAVRTTTSQSLTKQAEALAAARGQLGTLAQIRDKKSTITNNITVPVNVSVNARVVQQQLYTLRTTTGSGGFI